MATVVVVVGEVVAEQTAKVIGVEHYDVIEELAADAEHPVLRQYSIRGPAERFATGSA